MCSIEGRSYPYIVPRVIFEASIQNDDEITKISKLLMKLKKTHSFDGFTFEFGNELENGLKLMQSLHQIKRIAVFPPIIIKTDSDKMFIETLASVCDR